MLILIAEDDEHLRKVLQIRLLKDGYQVIVATDGQDALDKLSSHFPDLVITDIVMPYISGLEVVKFVKANTERQVPVIVLSALGQEEIVQEAFLLGADDFIVKPFSLAEFVLRLRRFALMIKN
ncbi:response regulator transcription factor [Olivibacter domesticus]|uniref:Response regulator receiver domain-containing protein n=1 Tax=Olivibacter domesticus TaxID=407022 RepID=A0A1H7KXG5_OLID1|nr:response regulator [Olivibacter domesticus]SEK91422.1 Response regulator receiver domain-containing protein [Olivibacter domesticus]